MHWPWYPRYSDEMAKKSVIMGFPVVPFNQNKHSDVCQYLEYLEELPIGGLRPVHFKSRTMTPTEKRYNQTEKRLLAIHCAKKRYSMYLLGTTKFQIITAHKPLLPLFNKASIKLPPWIEKWVMGMQDVHFEPTYEPGKDDTDPLLRHLLTITGKDTVENVFKYVISTEHAVVIDTIKEETPSQLEKLSVRILSGDWDKHKKDPDVAPFNEIHQEVSIVDDLIFRTNRIVIPTSLQRKVIKAAHQLGHPGMMKTKKALGEKYWFPTMNSMVEQIITECYECQVTTKQYRKEPVKVTDIPKKPWEIIAVDFGGPCPDGH